MSVKNHSDLNAEINLNITSNGNGDITGSILNQQLKDISDSSVNKLEYEIDIATADISTIGLLSPTDWNTFNNKQNVLPNASSSASGILTSTDWNTFNNKQNTLSQANGSTNGFLASADWTTFNNKLTSPLTTKGDIIAYSTTNARFPVGADGQVLLADSTQTFGIKWGTATGGSGGTESGTSFRIGSGTVMNTTKNNIGGINSTGQGINATVWGANSNAGQNGITLGNDNFTSATTVGNVIVISQGATNVKTSAANSIVIAPIYTKADGYGGVYLGRDINVGGTTPANTANNLGVYIGMGVTHTGGTYAGCTIIGANNNGRDSNTCVLVGRGITTANGLQNSVVVGPSAQSIDGQVDTVVVGFGAKAYLDGTFGSTGNGQVAIGTNTFAGSWRATAIGGQAQALAVSTTAIGYGSYVNIAHGSVWGRGGYNDLGGALIYSGATTNGLVYVGATAAKWTNNAMPGGETIDNITALNAGTIISKIYGIPGRDTTAVTNNIRGGHIRISGGPSTGSALGGELQFATTPAGASGTSVNSEVVAASFDAVATGGSEQTRFMILDLTTGTLKRVSFGANDSAGAGFKYLRVAN